MSPHSKAGYKSIYAGFSFGVLFFKTHPYSFHIALSKDRHFPAIVKLERRHFSKSSEETVASVVGHHSHKSPFFQPKLKEIKKQGPTGAAEGAQNMPLKNYKVFPNNHIHTASLWWVLQKMVSDDNFWVSLPNL